jgi:hypothetical protein
MPITSLTAKNLSDFIFGLYLPNHTFKNATSYIKTLKETLQTNETYTMKIRYIFALILLSSCTVPQDLTCGDFKIGTFKGEATNYQMPTTTVSRSEKTQKESADGLETLEATIEWKSECNYELIYLNGAPDIKGQKVSVEIIKIEGQKAICAATVEGMPGINLNFEMEKLK